MKNEKYFYFILYSNLNKKVAPLDHYFGLFIFCRIFSCAATPSSFPVNLNLILCRWNGECVQNERFPVGFPLTRCSP